MPPRDRVHFVPLTNHAAFKPGSPHKLHTKGVFCTAGTIRTRIPGQQKKGAPGQPSRSALHFTQNLRTKN